jgi:hypothetical protein
VVVVIVVVGIVVVGIVVVGIVVVGTVGLVRGWLGIALEHEPWPASGDHIRR